MGSPNVGQASLRAVVVAGWLAVMAAAAAAADDDDAAVSPSASVKVAASRFKTTANAHTATRRYSTNTCTHS